MVTTGMLQVALHISSLAGKSVLGDSAQALSIRGAGKVCQGRLFVNLRTASSITRKLVCFHFTGGGGSSHC